jgi:hypothetical protein
MKACKWPRPPLILGFILGSIIEQNLQSALSAYGAFAFVTRPITLALIAATIVAVAILTRVEARAPTLPRSTGGELARRRPVLGGAWRLEHWFALGILLVVLWAIWTALGFPVRARFMPLLAGTPVAVLLVFLLLFQRGKATGEIMDIGLRCVTVPGCGRTALIVAGFIAAFLLLSAVIGLQYAVIAFALSFPLVMGEGPMRWVAGACAGIIVAVVSLVLLDQLMGVLWPDTIVWDLIFGTS